MLAKCLLLLTFVGTVYCGGCSVDGITYAVGEEMPSHPCQPCVCSEAGQVCGSVECGRVQCSNDYALVEKKVPGECCTNKTCVPITCEVNGVTYNIGELIPDDDPCGSCKCVRIRGNLTHGGILCFKRPCTYASCPIITKRVTTQIPGVCCLNVQCVNMTNCEVNGVTYNVGDKIPVGHPCYDCLCTESGPVCRTDGC